MRKSKERVGFIIDGKLYGERSIRKKYGTQKKEEIQRLIPNVQIVKQKSKARYFYFRGDKRRKRELRKQIEHLIKPYPKREG